MEQVVANSLRRRMMALAEDVARGRELEAFQELEELAADFQALGGGGRVSGSGAPTPAAGVDHRVRERDGRDADGNVEMDEVDGSHHAPPPGLTKPPTGTGKREQEGRMPIEAWAWTSRPSVVGVLPHPYVASVYI